MYKEIISSQEVFQKDQQQTGELLTQRVAKLLKKLGYSAIEEVDNKVFYGALWVSIRTDDLPSITSYHTKIQEHPIYKLVKKQLVEE